MSDENPYATPEARIDIRSWDGRLTALERKLLVTYRAWHDRPPTLLRMVGMNWKPFLFLLVYGLGSFALCVSFHIPNVGYLVLGFVCGAILRDLGTFRRLYKLWPFLDEVLNWRRIDQLLDD